MARSARRPGVSIERAGFAPASFRTSRFDEQVPAIEDHGFTLIDFLEDKMVIRLFKWDVNTQPLGAIDTLEPFHTVEKMI